MEWKIRARERERRRYFEALKVFHASQASSQEPAGAVIACWMTQ